MNVDPALMMFISACCASCADTTCQGALTATTKRASCQKYLKWLKLPSAKRVQFFAEAVAGEILNLQELTNE